MLSEFMAPIRSGVRPFGVAGKTLSKRGTDHGHANVMVILGGVNVLSLEGLLVAKRAAARGKDKESIIELEALLELRKKQSPS